MRTIRSVLVLAVSVCSANTFSEVDFDLSGYLGSGYRYYLEDSSNSLVVNDSRLDAVISPKIVFGFNSSYRLVFEAFTRMGNVEAYRNHSDIRQFNIQMAFKEYDFTIGVIKEFWGVAESRNIVNIVNQVDLAEGIDEKERLGQMAVSLYRITKAGSFGLYWLPEFRKREYPDSRSRFSFAPPVVSDEYDLDENSNEGSEFAIRYSGSIGELDIGLHGFSGINREPIYFPEERDISIRPHYPDAQQVGTDLQYTHDAWLLKIEAIKNRNKYEDYYSLVAGFEYTFFQMFSSVQDLGLVGEYLYSVKKHYFIDPLSNDIFYGVRYASNGLSSAVLLVGVIKDLDTGGYQSKIEYSARLSNKIRVKFDSIYISDDDELDSFRNDSYSEFTIEWHL